MKFDNIYNEALVNLNTPNNIQSSTPNNNTQPQKIDQNKLNIISQKLQKAKAQNQPVNLTPDDLETLTQVMGGDNPQINTDTTKTNTGPVVQNPQALNKPQVRNSPAI